MTAATNAVGSIAAATNAVGSMAAATNAVGSMPAAADAVAEPAFTIPPDHTERMHKAHVVVDDGLVERDMVVEYLLTATIGDLGAALGLGGELRIGSLTYSPNETLGVVDLHDGALIREAAGSGQDSSDAAASTTSAGQASQSHVVLEQLSGDDSGRSVLVAEGHWRLRSDRGDDSTIELVQASQGPAGGPLVWRPGDVRQSGTDWFGIHPPARAAELRWETPATSVRSRRVHRPPRVAPAPEQPSVTFDDPGPAPQPPQRPSAVTLLIPLAIGAVVAILYRPWFLLFSLLAPAMSLGRWWDGHRRYRKDSRIWQAETTAMHAQQQTSSSEMSARDLVARRVAIPSLAELAVWCVSGHARLWERRTEHADFLHLAVGWHAVESTSGRGWPAAVDLSGGRSIGVSGDPSAVEAMCRSFVIQAAALHGPADLALAVPSLPGWDWCKWLPHVGASSSDAADVLSVVPANEAPLRPDGSHVVFAARSEDLPSWCDHVFVADAPGASLVNVGTGSRVEQISAVGCQPALARAAALGLAPLFDPDQGAGAGLGADQSVVFEDTTDWHGDLSDELGTLAVVLGLQRSNGDPIEVDLVRHGPHALVAGTTGSGKSELLRTWVLALAARHRADRCQFVLIDFKGGGAFDPLHDLPHTAAIVTDLDPAVAERALIALRAELTSREEWLRLHDLSDIANRSQTALRSPRPPRLVLMVDEFATLAADLPEFLDGLIDIAQRGRSLGVHLVLATQRPSGVVDQRIRSNMGIRICLRVQHDSESVDIVGVNDAARFGADTPGRAVLLLDANSRYDLQAAQVVAPRPKPDQSVRAHPFAGPAERGPASTALADKHGEADPAADAFAPWVAAIAHRSSVEGQVRADPPWLAPLNASLEFDSICAELPDSGVALGLTDDPRNRTQDPWIWNMHEPLAVVGGSSVERLETVQLLLAAAHRVGRRVALVAQDPVVRDRCVVGDATMVESGVEPLARLLDLIEQNSEPCMVIIDRYELFGVGADDREYSALRERLDHLLCSGTTRHCAIAVLAPSERSIPHRVQSQIAHKLLLDLADPLALSMFGIRPQQVPERDHRGAVDVRSGLVVQLADVPEPHDRLPAALAVPKRPAAVPVRASADSGRADSGDVVVSVGINIATLDVVDLTLRPGRPTVVAGPPGSGRTSALRSLAASAMLGTAAASVVVVGHDMDWRDLDQVETLQVLDPEAPDFADALRILLSETADSHGSGSPTLLVVDGVESPEGQSALESCVCGEQVAVVVSGTVEAFRRPGTFLNRSARARHGLILSADRLDTDLLRAPGLRYPGVAWSPGQGVVVSDRGIRHVQCAQLPPGGWDKLTRSNHSG